MPLPQCVPLMLIKVFLICGFLIMFPINPFPIIKFFHLWLHLPPRFASLLRFTFISHSRYLFSSYFHLFFSWPLNRQQRASPRVWVDERSAGHAQASSTSTSSQPPGPISLRQTSSMLFPMDLSSSTSKYNQVSPLSNYASVSLAHRNFDLLQDMDW
jgi:hypothetical protein